MWFSRKNHPRMADHLRSLVIDECRCWPDAPDSNRNGKESTAHVTNNAVTQPAKLQDAGNAVIPRLTFRFRSETKRVR